MKKLLLPIDFSPCSTKAVKFGLQIAQILDAEVTFIYVSPIPAGGDITFFVDEPIYEASKARANQEFEKLERSTSGLKSISYHFRFEVGFPVQTITQVAEDLQADLIVLGTKGISNKIDEIFGTTSSGIIKVANRPVLAIPNNAEPTSIKQIALATNFKTEANYDIIEIMFQIANGLNSEIHVVTITNETEPRRDHFNRQKMKLWSENLENLRHHFHFIKHDDVEEGLMDYVEGHDIDMLVVMPSKLNFIKNLFHKSVSKRLAYHTQVPLLV